MDRTTSGGKIGRTLQPTDAADPYVAASAGPQSSLLLHASGAVASVAAMTGDLVVSSLPSPEGAPGVRYTAVTAGAAHSFLLRSDGAVDRVLPLDRLHQTWGRETMRAELPSVRYTAVSAGGGEAGFLLRDDGAVDVVRGLGGVEQTLVAPEGGSGVEDECASGGAGAYMQLGVQCAVANSQRGTGATLGSSCACFVRADGSIQCIDEGGSSVRRATPPDGVRYVAASSAGGLSYLVRDDGGADRLEHAGEVEVTLTAPGGGARYVAAAAGQWASYLLRSDGLCDRTSGGKVRLTMCPPTPVLPSASPATSSGVLSVIRRLIAPRDH